jgi:mono/diheme cytochrome c family protein
VKFGARMLTTLAVAAATAIATAATAQHTGHGASPPTPSTAGGKPAPVSMEELHRHGGVPRGWKFTLPAGDPKAGREVFAKLECNKCHEIKPDFPRGERGAGDVGPELTGMGDHHPAEYFAQSIIDPNAVIVAGTGFVGADGRSVMPDYRDSVTFTELVDIVAYLKSLGGGAHAHHHAAMPTREQTAGPYRLRVAYHAPGQHAHHSAGGAPPTGHLMAFVTDTATGEPVPYLPVSVVITAAKTAPRTVRLAPMVGGDGFHYGADVTVPQGTTKVTVNVGVAGLKTTGAAAGRFGKPVTVSFDWSE